MPLTQISKIDPDEFSRCEERKQMEDHEKKSSSIQKADATIKESIYRAFWKNNILRTMEYYEVDVHVRDGCISLNGHIVSATSQSLIENAIKSIRGISGIKNNLVLDDKLAVEVAVSLGKLACIYGCTFFSVASHGVISLNGIVNNANVKLLAEQCAAGNPNVRGVLNNIRILGTRAGFQEQQFIQPTIGENVYFLDGICGVVKQVVINPNNRCVIAMIIEGRFADQRQKIDSLTVIKAFTHEQTLVIPMRTVRYLTRASGFLDIHSNEKKRYMQFDPVHFFAPAKDWKAPYPYCPEDVLFLVSPQDPGNQVMQQLFQSPFAATLEDTFLKEQFLANDSLGG